MTVITDIKWSKVNKGKFMKANVIAKSVSIVGHAQPHAWHTTPYAKYHPHQQQYIVRRE